MILAIKTAGDPTEIYLLDSDGKVLQQKIWPAGRNLARDLLGEIEELLKKCHSELDSESTESSRKIPESSSGQALNQVQNDKNIFSQFSGIIIFRGPGSFTGLRIGITTANAIAYAEQIPIVGANGEKWIAYGLEKLSENRNDRVVLPEYGAQPNITKSGSARASRARK